MPFAETLLRLLPRSRKSEPIDDRDRTIAEHLQRLFEEDLALTGFGGLRFFVHRGTVHLAGDDLLPADREAVTDMVLGVPGVRRVVDRPPASDLPKAA